MKTKIYTHNISANIIELFEEILDQHNIRIPDVERAGDDSESCLYGDIYSNLLDDVENILIDTMETLNLTTTV